MEALFLADKETLSYSSSYQQPPLAEDEVDVEIKAASLNHRDVWITQGMYPGITFPTILGSDGAGLAAGRPVLINPSIGWGNHPAYQDKQYQILGMPKHGTLAGRVAVPAAQLYDMPPHLSFEQAAAIPLAGLTAYRAVFSKGQVRRDDRVLITGIGGGVALFALLFAQAAGAEVYVSSGHDEKLDSAIGLGAKAGVNYHHENWAKELQQRSGGIDLVIDGAGGQGLQAIMKICSPGARLVLYGGGQGAVPELSPQLIFWKQLSILGTSMGTDAEFAAMLALINQHQLVPVVDEVYPLSEGKAAFRRMHEGKQFGKIVLVPS
jgi:NADPH:quinone reductase-like Zn-dependent oxidoreductase